MVAPRKPYFYINGHDFPINMSADSESTINLIKNKMYVAGKNWGYTDIQWTNFTGEEITLETYSRNTDVYQGEPAQPNNGGIYDFYNESRTPHAVLKYWAQNFVQCIVKTNLEAFENGTYVIDTFKQSNPSDDFVTTQFTLIQYEKPGEIEQTYWKPEDIDVLRSTAQLSAQSQEVSNLTNHTQNCSCTEITPKEKCTATFNVEVEIIQKYLQQWGYFPSYVYGKGNIEVNGKFCYYTTQALRNFQEDCGIDVTGEFNDLTKSYFIKKLEGIW